MRCADMWRCWSLSNQSRGGGAGTTRCVVSFPTSLISNPRWNGGLCLQPVAHRCGGKLALAPVGCRGEEREGAAEEPRQVHLRRILHRRIHTGVKVRDPVRRRGDHVDGGGGDQTAPPHDRGIQMVYAIPTVTSLLVGAEGPQLPPPSLAQASTPPAVRPVAGRRTGGSWPPLVGSGSDMGLVRYKLAQANPCHSHARRRRPSIHRDDGAMEGCQRWQVMEPHS